MEEEVGEVLISREQIEKRTRELGEEISRDYKEKDLVCVAILRGGFIFIADLCRHIKIPAQFDFMAVSSYGNKTQSSGVVRIVKDLDVNIRGRDVLIVEDIVDTGRTIRYLHDNLWTREPKSLEICTLLDKPKERIAQIKIKYVGFSIPSKFVVGYGLDYAEDYRHLPDVRILDPKYYQS